MGQVPRDQAQKFAGRLWRPEIFFASAVAPGYKFKNFFYPWDTHMLLPGKFPEKNSPPLTPQGSFSEKFEIFGPFLAKLGGE